MLFFEVFFSFVLWLGVYWDLGVNSLRKPENILVSETGKVFLGDFGVSHYHEEAADSLGTATTLFVETYLYIILLSF